MNSAMTRLASDSPNVAGSELPTKAATGCLKEIDIPRSPFSARPNETRYCVPIPWSSPGAERSASASARVAEGGSIIPSGSTGSSRSTTKTTKDSAGAVTPACNTLASSMRATRTITLAPDHRPPSASCTREGRTRMPHPQRQPGPTTRACGSCWSRWSAAHPRTRRARGP